MAKDFRFSATNDTYHAHSDNLKFNLSQPAVVCACRYRNNPQELILSIGETQDDVQRAPGYQTVATQGEIRFCNPFEPTNFNAFLSEAVVRYYLARASNTRTTIAKILALIRGGKFEVQLDLAGYASVSPVVQQAFESRLSKSVFIKTWRII